MRVLVAGDEAWRGRVAARLEQLGIDADDADPDLGDVVVFIRFESDDYDAVVFAGHSDRVTRGALVTVAEKAVLLPLVDDEAAIDPRHDGYLFRLPRALGFRNDSERALVYEAVPPAADLASELVGDELAAENAFRALLEHATTGDWRWAGGAPQ